MKDERFSQRIAYLIDFESFIDVMSDILDDSSLSMDENSKDLFVYSNGYDCGYDDIEIMERIGDRLDVHIVNYFKDVDTKCIYFMKDE